MTVQVVMIKSFVVKSIFTGRLKSLYEIEGRLYIGLILASANMGTCLDKMVDS
jgi:hypothetical protein